MEEHYQFPNRGYQRVKKQMVSRKVTQCKQTRYNNAPKGTRAMLIIDGAYFQQGTEKYLNDKFGVNLYDTSSPDILMVNFIETIEEWLNVNCIERYYITSLFDEGSSKSILDSQNAFIDTLKRDCKFEIDCREFKNMSVYCTNKQCSNSHKPIKRKVQAEVDVAIATKVLSMAFQDEYDILIAVTGDRDFKD